MKVEMKVHTRFGSRKLAAGDEIDVEQKVAERWARAGIAETIEAADYSPMLLPLEELEKLPPEQLLDYAKVHQVDTGRATSAAGLLEKITEAGKVFTKTEE